MLRYLTGVRMTVLLCFKLASLTCVLYAALTVPYGDMRHCITVTFHFLRQQTNESSNAVIPVVVWIAGLKCVGGGC